MGLYSQNCEGNIIVWGRDVVGILDKDGFHRLQEIQSVSLLGSNNKLFCLKVYVMIIIQINKKMNQK